MPDSVTNDQVKEIVEQLASVKVTPNGQYGPAWVDGGKLAARQLATVRGKYDGRNVVALNCVILAGPGSLVPQGLISHQESSSTLAHRMAKVNIYSHAHNAIEQSQMINPQLYTCSLSSFGC